MAASVPPPKPEGDGEKVDEDLEKKVHRRGSNEPDEPDRALAGSQVIRSR
jgi:hypothetical protein